MDMQPTDFTLFIRPAPFACGIGAGPSVPTTKETPARISFGFGGWLVGGCALCGA